MQKTQHRYLFRIQFLGFRYSGWQRQPGQKTIEEMLLKTFNFILPERKFKILGAGRTDAKVSALDAAFELFLEGIPIGNLDEFLMLFNGNLPPDIRALKLTEVKEDFNIIQHVKTKEYVYLFSFGQKNHPFCAPYLANIVEPLNIELMKNACSLFVGTHNFLAYTAKPQENTRFLRTIEVCEIRENTILSANFFRKKAMLFLLGEKDFCAIKFE